MSNEAHSPMMLNMYNLSITDESVVFSRRGTQYDMEMENEAVRKSFPYFQTHLSLDAISSITKAPSDTLAEVTNTLSKEGLAFTPREKSLGMISGEELYERFRATFDDWMQEAFSSNYWDRMTSGKGSRQLYTGYLLEIYHYTRNANRHMPMAVATCPTEWKSVKRLFAKHYEEEWDHYGFFSKALRYMGVDGSDVKNSVPLPSTLEMSNLMRQAARTSTMAYAICSAILEGTTEAKDNYGSFFKKIANHYDIDDAAIKPIFDHLELDEQYEHKSLFKEICMEIPAIDEKEAIQTFSFGRQMIDHIFMWTEQIESHYGASRPIEELILRPFDFARD